MPGRRTPASSSTASPPGRMHRHPPATAPYPTPTARIRIREVLKQVAANDDQMQLLIRAA